MNSNIEERINNIEHQIASLKEFFEKRMESMSSNVDIDGKAGMDFFMDKSDILIEKIIDNFDFKRVHDIMTFLKWEWASAKDGIPTVRELKNEARRLLDIAINEKTCVGSGGFSVEYEEDHINNSEPFLKLSFVVEESENY